MKPTAFLLALTLFACGVSSALAPQYKWTDENGKTRYGDVAPPGAKATLLKPPSVSPPPSGTGGAVKDAKDAKKGSSAPADQEMEFRKRQQQAQAAREKEEQARTEAANKTQNCARAQDALRTLESGQRISRVDAKGERYFPDEAAIEADKTSARKMVQDACG